MPQGKRTAQQGWGDDNSMNQRETFLHPPPQGAAPVPARLAGAVEQALRELEQAFPNGMNAKEMEGLLRIEATCSAAIEDEFDPERIARHHQAMTEFLEKPLTRESLLELHAGMMEEQPHSQPGRYRSVQVVVGQHRPPGPALVPSLMEELLEFVQRGEGNRIARATWAHVQFETIHPFADGNGRTGRAIINHILQSPIPLSRFIHADQQSYYRLFGLSDWESWLEWFLHGVEVECQRQRESREKYP